ncbi:hypothetical protein ACLOJK_041215 [Asimina triloba]
MISYMIFDAPPEHQYGAPSPSPRPAAMAAAGELQLDVRTVQNDGDKASISDPARLQFISLANTSNDDGQQPFVTRLLRRASASSPPSSPSASKSLVSDAGQQLHPSQRRPIQPSPIQSRPIQRHSSTTHHI